MPELFARFATKPRHIIRVDNVLRLSSSCFKRRTNENCLSIVCIDDCTNHEAVFDIGYNILRDIYGYGQLRYKTICSVEYCEEGHLCCSVTQIGLDKKHFELHPGRDDLAEMEFFQQVKACDLMSKRLSEQSIAFLPHNKR